MGVHIKVVDIERSRAFYTALGFRKVKDYGLGTSEPATYRGSFFAIGESSELEIADAHPNVCPEDFGRMVHDSKVSLFFRVDSLVPIIHAAASAGICLHDEPRVYTWVQDPLIRTIELVICDPDGVRLWFVSDATEEEQANTQAISRADIYRTVPDYTPKP